MPKVCRDHPNCKLVNCSFQHPFIVETQQTKQDGKVESIRCILFSRKNLNHNADLVRAAALNRVKGLLSTFIDVPSAREWIKTNANKDDFYEIRNETSDVLERWVYDKQRNGIKLYLYKIQTEDINLIKNQN